MTAAKKFKVSLLALKSLVRWQFDQLKLCRIVLHSANAYLGPAIRQVWCCLSGPPFLCTKHLITNQQGAGSSRIVHAASFRLTVSPLKWLKAALGSNVCNANKAFIAQGNAIGAGHVAYLSMQQHDQPHMKKKRRITSYRRHALLTKLQY